MSGCHSVFVLKCFPIFVDFQLLTIKVMKRTEGGSVDIESIASYCKSNEQWMNVNGHFIQLFVKNNSFEISLSKLKLRKLIEMKGFERYLNNSSSIL